MRKPAVVHFAPRNHRERHWVEPQPALAVGVVLVVTRRRSETQDVVQVMQHVEHVPTVSDGGGPVVKGVAYIGLVGKAEGAIGVLGIEQTAVPGRIGSNIVAPCFKGRAIEWGVMPAKGGGGIVLRVLNNLALAFPRVVEWKGAVTVC